VQAIAKDHDALFIADEMLTGFGRTGTMWGIEHDGVEPDVMTVGKGMGGGFPLSAVVSTDALTSRPPWSNPSASSSSYGGNPLAAAAGLATLEILIKEDLVRNAERVGQVMLRRLEALKEKHRCVGEVRGKGLMLGIELVSDRQTREPLARAGTRGLHVLCEKPLVVAPEDLTRVARLAEKTRRVVHTIHNWHHAPIIKRSVELVQQGTIGQVTHVTWQTLRTKPAAARDADAINWRL